MDGGGEPLLGAVGGAAASPAAASPSGPKEYDYFFKFLLVGDSDVGKVRNFFLLGS
jgi:hypothetical protein